MNEEAAVEYEKSLDLKNGHAIRMPPIIATSSEEPMDINAISPRRKKERDGQGRYIKTTSNNGCFECGSNNHWRRECPKVKTNSYPKKKGGDNGSKGNYKKVQFEQHRRFNNQRSMNVIDGEYMEEIEDEEEKKGILKKEEKVAENEAGLDF